MDFLEENFGAIASPVELSELVPTPLAPLEIPKSSIRNRAATTALLGSSPDKAIENYQLLMRESEEGGNAVYDSMKQSVLDNSSNMDMQGIMKILGDSSVSFEDKQKVFAGVKNSRFLKDSGNTLFTNSLSAPSKGENIEQEAARISSADSIREIYEARRQVQGLVNAHGASLSGDVGVGTTADMAALYVLPFGNNISVGKVNKAISKATGEKTTLWNTVKGFLLPGSTTENLRERLQSMPPEKRVEYAKAVIDGIKQNSGIVFGDDNQFAQYDKASTIFEEGGYSTVEKWMDNISGLLDIVGLGQIIRGGSRAVRGTKGILKQDLGDFSLPTESSRGSPIRVDSVKKEKPTVGITQEDLAKSTGKPTVDIYDQRIQDLIVEQLEIQAKDKQTKVDIGRLATIEREIGHLAVANTPMYLKKNPIVDAIERIEANAVVRVENPASPANILQQTNPEKARAVHEAVFRSEGDEVAEAMYGVNKTQAIINDVFPQVTTRSGNVTAKVVDIDRNLKTSLDEIAGNSGRTEYTPAEKAAFRANVVNDFQNAEGLTVNNAMSSFSKGEDGRIEISAVYGSTEGGFLRADDALQQSKYALRNYGIVDKDLEVLQKRGLDYVPVNLDEVRGKDGDFVVRVKTQHDIDPTAITESSFDVKRNLFDRVPALVSQNTGSASRYLMDAASMLHKVYTGPASVVSDATARFDKFMLKLASEYSDKYVKLDKVRKAKVDDYIREANFKGIKFDQTDLVARGFQLNEIEALQKWKNFWDGHFYLENADVVKTLSNQGYQLFKNQNTELYAKPIPKNQNIAWFYDPAIDDVVRHGKGEGDILYAAGGTYAKLRRPIVINGATVEHMVVRNTPTEYTRKFNSSDQVLNYRDGYFQIQYKAPRFVEEITRDSKGNITGTKAVAVAGDTKEAEFFASRLQSQNGKEYNVRGDVRELARDNDAWWDLNSASGRISQRHRGKLLEDASGLNHLGDGSYILDPVESAIRAAKSIAGRTVARPMLEAAKARAITQYGDLFPPNDYGGRKWPNNVSEISERGKETGKRVADARTTYEYINYLENGYINSLDEIFKQGFNGLANMFGKIGVAPLERGAMIASDWRPTSLAKNGVFMAYIGTNPFRQWIVQTHQVVRTFAYNPVGWANGRVPYLFTDYISHIMGLKKIYTKDEQAFIDFINNSGMMDAVDKSNLVRGTLSDAADASTIQGKVAKYSTTPLRRVGFDIGEQANLLGHAAAVYEKHMRNGLDLSNKTLRDDAYSEIRAISYDMNFAGDMVYNQTTPSMVLQFMQVPHKAFLQMTNRRIDPMTRLRMAGSDIVMWGGPGVLIADLLGVDILPDNPELKEYYLWGLESLMLNKLFSWMSDENVNLDFSSLAPYEMTGWSKFFEAMYSGGLDQVLANSPAGQLFLKEGGRAQSAIKSMARYFGIIEDIDETPEEFLSVMNEVLKMSSGWNNGVKAKIMLDARKKYDQYGSAIDQSTGTVEAWAQGFGFTTADARDLYRVSMEWSKDVKTHREDTIKVYEDIKRYYAEKLEVENSDPVFITKVTGRVMKVFQEDHVALAIISNQLSQDLVGKDEKLLQLFMKRSAIPSVSNIRDEVKQMPVSDEEKQLMLQRIDDVINIRPTLKE